MSSLNVTGLFYFIYFFSLFGHEMYDISLPTLDYTNKYSTKGNRPSSIIHIGYQLEITTNNTIEDNNLQAVI